MKEFNASEDDMYFYFSIGASIISIDFSIFKLEYRRIDQALEKQNVIWIIQKLIRI